MREVSTKILLGFLVAGLVIPALLFVRPQKAEALLSLAACFAAKGVAAAQATASAAPGAIISVNTSDTANTIQSGVAPAGTDWRSCFLGSLAKIIAKTLLHTFTQSIVNWINTGFEGSPSFVTNPEGFLNDVADQTIGRVIEDISPLLCAPFKLDIRFALGLNLSLNSRDEVHCRLSDVISNVRGAYDSFVTGTIGSGNLSNWIHIAGTQSNNPYGAYIATTDIMSARIVSATGQQVKLLDWGNGFKSWRPCVERGPDVPAKDKEGNLIKDKNNMPTTRKGACIKEGPIKTPGSIIQDQTTGALGTTLRELELASEIDEVVGALINQLLVKAMTGVGGLLGASKGDSSNGGVSAVEALMTDPNAAVANADTKAPTGINCRLRYYPATKEELPAGSKIYVPNDDDDTAIGTQVWTDNLGDRTIIGPDEQDASTPIVRAFYADRKGEIITDVRYVRGGDILKAVTRGVNQTWETYFNTVREGCSNEWNTLITNASTGALATTPGAGGATTGAQKPPSTSAEQISTGNIALHKLADQTSINYNDSSRFGPQNLTNGIRSGNSSYGAAMTSWNGGYDEQKWFMVDLESIGQTYGGVNTTQGKIVKTEIEKIKIFGTDGDYYNNAYGAYNQTGPFHVYVTTTDPRGATEAAFRMNTATVKYAGSYYLDMVGGKNGLLRNAIGATNPTEAIVECANSATDCSLTFKSPIIGRYIYILQNSALRGYHFGLAEIEVIGKQLRLDEQGAVEPPKFAITASPVTKLFTSPESSIKFDTWRSSFLPNKSESGIRFRAKFFTCDLNVARIPNVPCTYNPAPEAFWSHLSSLAITYTNGDMTRTKNAIRVGAPYGYTYNTDAENKGSGDTVIVEEIGTTFFFADDLSVVENNPVTVSITGTPKQKIRFRIVIEAEQVINGVPIPLGKATADFVMP